MPSTAPFNVETKGEADGYCLHYGYALINELELDLRYDVYSRMMDVAPNLASTHNTNLILDGMDDRLSAQLPIIFQRMLSRA